MRIPHALNATRRAHWLALLAGLACAPAVLAQAPPFNGRWQLDDAQPARAQAQGQAARPAYTMLDIQGATLSWRGRDKSAPSCNHRFALKKEAPGTAYRNARGTEFIAGVAGSLPTYLLEIRGSDCASPVDAVRISYPLVYDVRHIEVIEYVGGKAVSARRLQRRK